MKAKCEWEGRRYSDQDKSLQLYYNEQLKKAKVSVPKMEPHEVNFIIVNQFPQRIRDILSTIDYADRDKISQALARLDLSSSGIQDRKWHQNNNFGKTNNINHGGASRVVEHSEIGESSQNTRKHTNWRERNNFPRESNVGNGPQVDKNREEPRRDVRREGDRSENIRNVENRVGNNNIRSNIRTMQITPRSEFIETLCWDVEPSIEEQNKNQVPRVISPRILVAIDDVEYEMLIDSGSEITCISEEFYNDLKKDRNLVELPVSNIAVYGAVSKKTTTIKKQIQLTIKIGEHEINFPFLVVPGLSTKLIGGADWQSKFNLIIDFEKYNIVFQGVKLPRIKCLFFAKSVVEGARICTLVRDRDGSSDEKESIETNENTVEHEFNDCQVITLTENDEYDENLRRLGSLHKKFFYVKGDSSANSDIENTRHEGYNILNLKCQSEDAFEKEVDVYINEIETLTLEQKEKVREVLLTYREAFSDRPGCTNNYKHHIVPISDKIYVKKSYPVPMSLRPPTDDEIKRMEDLDVIERTVAQFLNPKE